MRICMVGSGYVGLVSGPGFAETGNDVICADVDAQKIDRLNAGELPIFEPGLKELIKHNVKEKRLTFTSDVGAAIASSQVIFIGVGTPPRADGSADLSAVDAVARLVEARAEREVVLVVKSTVPVGTNARLKSIVASAKHRVHVISNPEFLKEGDAVNDFLRPDRVVIGVDPYDGFARDTMARLYHPFCLDRDRLVWMDPASAELTKYVANTMLAMRISFMNEIAALCDKIGADIHSVRIGVGTDTRIGGKFLYSGPGYGGSCFPKDVTALVHTAREHDIPLDLAAATDAVNRRQKMVLFQKLVSHLGEIRGKHIAVWGLAFKPRTDDTRESPSLILIDALIEAGATVCVHDPEATMPAREGLEFAEDHYVAARDADALVLVTEWRQYQNPNFERLKETMNRPLLIDGRNIWSGYGLRALGFTYDSIGARGT